MQVQILEYDVLESTNTTAVQYARSGASNGTVIVAKKQSAGHGRMDRVWSSPEGGLWFTLILRPKVNPENIAQLTLIAGVAITSTLRRLYATDEIRIKWPNDLLVNNKKICGILSEMQLDETGNVDYAIVGVGLNVNLVNKDFTQELQGIATSLKIITGIEHSCKYVLYEILGEFAKFYDLWLANGMKAILPYWEQLNCTLGKKVIVKDNDQEFFAGTAVAVDKFGALSVCSDEGIVKAYDFGEISIR